MRKVLQSLTGYRTVYLVTLAVVLVLSVASFTSNAHATASDTEEETEYKFRLANNHVNKTPYIRCGTSGDWSTAGRGWSKDITCSGSLAQTKLGDGATINHTHNCSPKPVMRIEYSGYWLGGRLSESLKVGCRSS